MYKSKNISNIISPRGFLKRILFISMFAMSFVFLTNCPQDTLPTQCEAPAEAAPGSLQAEINGLVDSLVTNLVSVGFQTNFTQAQLDAVATFNGAPTGFIVTVGKVNVSIETSPALIFYNEGMNGRAICPGVVAPAWEQATDEQRTLFNLWASNASAYALSNQSGSAFDGEHFFGETFNWFFLFHEVGHYMQFIRTVRDSAPGAGDLYFREKEANEFALAFLKNNNRPRLDAYITNLRSIFATLPPPTNTNRTFFNSDYGNLSRIPEIYGYFQFNFVLDAYDNRIDDLELSNFVTEKTN